MKRHRRARATGSVQQGSSFAKTSTHELALASEMLSLIGGLFDAPRASTCGALSVKTLPALWALFWRLHINHLVVSQEEYYSSEHFLDQVRLTPVDMSDPQQAAQQIAETRPGAVIASVTTWRTGTVLPVAALFAELRSMNLDPMPLLIADYSHAGAAGFPSIGTLQADLVFADPSKWILRPRKETPIRFFWSPNPRIDLPAVFRSMYLASAQPPDPSTTLSGGWLEPAWITDYQDWCQRHNLDRERLLNCSSANYGFAQELAARLQLPPPSSSILWTEHDLTRHREVSKLAELGLVWKTPGGGTRILCRKDLLGRR